MRKIATLDIYSHIYMMLALTALSLFSEKFFLFEHCTVKEYILYINLLVTLLFGSRKN